MVERYVSLTKLITRNVRDGRELFLQAKAWCTARILMVSRFQLVLDTGTKLSPRYGTQREFFQQFSNWINGWCKQVL